MAMLEVKNLNVYYGVIHALHDVSFEVEEGEVVALIGANGAGKTTTLHTVTGLLQAKSGSVVFEGKDITKKPGHEIVRMGIGHVPEGRRVFANLTVEENLRRTLVLSDGSFSIFLSHPIALVLLAIAAISLLSPIFLNLWKKRSTNKQSGN